MNFNMVRCPHIDSPHFSQTDIKLLEKPISCKDCQYTGMNLWLCLYDDCMYIGCSEQACDHSTQHFQLHHHAVHMNISSQRIWCYFCERELYLKHRNGTIEDNLFSHSLSSFSLREDDSLQNNANGSGLGSGLIGLQNIANTCYMNSALQALSNLKPMTHYFMNCGDILEHMVDQNSPRCKSVGLAKSYQRLMSEMWSKCNVEREHIAPRGILYGIRTVHPMFRGYQQHDTQEFLRCFMDQLHEELKESDTTHGDQITSQDEDGDLESVDSNTPCNISDSEYETCGSSMSESINETETLIKTEYLGYSSRTTLNNEFKPLVKHQKSPVQQFAPQQKQTASRSIISDIFDGKLLSSVQCLTCDRISTREETFQDLSLPIPTKDFLNMLHQTHSLSVQSLNALDISARSNEGWIQWIYNLFRTWLNGPSVTLYDCMASFFSADELKGDNMYSCDKCNKLRTGIKYSRVLHLPEVLCIHLKRFRHDLAYSSKIASHVYFPLEGFDMHNYVHKDCKSAISNYNLTSVICHHGTVGGGHYTCYGRNPLNGRWYEYDDQCVTEVSTDTVQNCQAYVLFYEKYNPTMTLLREEAIALSNSYPCPQVDMQFYISREWITRFATFAEPGPINNRDILCPHGGISHAKLPLLSQIAVPISQQVWDFLYRKFGGGPCINMLFECEVCKANAEALERRQNYEFNIFTKYNGLQNEMDSSAIYAIAMPWLRKWQQFSRGLTSELPGPITNEGIQAVNETFNTIALSNNTTILRGVRSGSDYAQLSAPVWRFLHDVYGGGPEIMLRSSLTETRTEEIEIIDQDEHENIASDFDISDTESNIGENNALSINEVKVQNPQIDSNTPQATHSQYIPPIQTIKTTLIAHPTQQVVQATQPNETIQPNISKSSPKAASSLPGVKDPRFNRVSANNTKKFKVPGLNNTSLRKRSKKSRNALKHADMFGIRGTYSQSNEVKIEPTESDLQDNTTLKKYGEYEHENILLQKYVILSEDSDTNINKNNNANRNETDV